MLLPLFFWIIGMYAALKLEKMKKNKYIQTYRGILAYVEGNDVEKQRQLRNKKKDRGQKALIVLGCTIVFTVIMLIAMFIAMKFT